MATAINSHDLNNVEQRVTTLEYGHAENKEKIARISDTVFGDDENGGLITAVRVQNSELKTLIETVKSLKTALWAVVIIVLGQVIIIGMGSIFSNQNVSEIFTATMGF
jgi:uncharacterized coiled-coil protein SlyX